MPALCDYSCASGAQIVAINKSFKSIKIYLEKKKEIGGKEKSKRFIYHRWYKYLCGLFPTNNHFQLTDSSEALVAPRCF